MQPTVPRLVLAAALACCGTATAADVDTRATAEQLRDQAMAGSGAFTIVESLTTQVGPRMAGTDGDARAVAWAKRSFARLGFDRVVLQPVTFPTWTRGHEHAEVLAPAPQPLVVTTLGGSVGTNGPLAGEVVAFPDLAALQAADPAQVQGRIAFIEKRMQRFRDGHGYGEAVGARSNGAVEAARKGAIAVLIRSIGTDSDRLPHTGLMRYADGVPQIPAAALSNPDADQLSRLLALGEPVRVQLDLGAQRGPDYTSYNVIGEVTGSTHPDEFVVIGGHLDSWDLGTGAIDDGAGVAITMAAGALIGRLDTPPARTIRVVAFANEEQGLVGGRVYAKHAGEALKRHVIGAESDFGAGRIYAFRTVHGADAPAWVRQAGAVMAQLGIEWQPEGGGPGPDLIHAAQGGMPWAQLAQDGTDYFDWHHTANDTLDKIEPAALDQQVAAYAVLAWMAANH